MTHLTEARIYELTVEGKRKVFGSSLRFFSLKIHFRNDLPGR
jgi:hypothetical protein